MIAIPITSTNFLNFIYGWFNVKCFYFLWFSLFFISTKQSEAVVQGMTNIVLNLKQFHNNICRFRDKLIPKYLSISFEEKYFLSIFVSVFYIYLNKISYITVILSFHKYFWVDFQKLVNIFQWDNSIEAKVISILV